MRRLLPLVALFALLGPAAAQKADPKKPELPRNPLAEAEKRLLKGNYEEAREKYAELAKADDKLRPAAVVGTAETYRQAGDLAKAAEVLDAAAKEFPKSADVLAARGELLYSRGKWDDADKDIDAAIAADANCARARWIKACLLREQGKLDEAKTALRWFLSFYKGREVFTAAESTYIALGGAELARWNKNAQQFNLILNTILKDALKTDPDYWPAEQVAGDILLEKYNRPDAVESFDNALKVNPKAADALVGKARAAAVKFDLKDADSYADQALRAHPNHPAALRVKADILLVAGDFPAAKKLLDAAKAVNPRDAATLGRLAAVALVTHDAAGFEAMEKDVASWDGKPGAFYAELAAALDERKQYPKAEGYYKKALELRPVLSAPLSGLGLLYLRMGDEAEGRKLLDQAFKADPFNVRVSNSRRVLRHLEDEKSPYRTVETAHYVLKYNPQTDGVLGEWIADYLEEVHAALKGQFGFEPAGKVLIEVFNTHEMFSGRTVGVPDLHTVGACIGRVVALASPTAKGLSKPYNWGRVIRHEVTHLFNLAQTDYQCPHWVTEGLAVGNERMNRPPSWTAALRDRFAKNDLLTLDTILLGFVRPKNPEEWTLAYCQSQLYIEYLVKTAGKEAVGKLLAEYKAGHDTAAALQSVCGVSKAEFEKGYKAHVTRLVDGLDGGKAVADKPMTFDELKAAVEENPADLNLKARLAEQHLRRGNAADAKKLAEAVLDKEPAHPTAAVVKAKLLQRAGDEEEAKKLIEAALKGKPDDVKGLLAVGRLHLERKEWKEAAEAFEAGRKLAPDAADWLEQLARIYKETKETDKLSAVLAEMVGQDPDDLPGRVTLAKLNAAAGEWAKAEAFARDALMIDVTHAEAKGVYLEALRKQKKDATADKVEGWYAK